MIDRTLYRIAGWEEGSAARPILKEVELDYEAAQRVYERHVDAAVFDMVLSKTGGKAIVDAALGADDE